MKKLYSFLVALMMLAIPAGMWGQTTYTIGWGTASGTVGTYTNFTSTSGTVQNILSFSTDKNSSSTNPAYNSNGSELRLYYASSGDGGSITITPISGITITNAVMTTSTAPSVAYYVDGGSAVSVSASSNTYTISDISASNSLKIQNVNSTNTQLRIKTIALTYTSNGSQPTTYTVTYHANVTGTTDIVKTYNEGDDVTIADNTFTNPGYAFTEWNTEADGSGDSYDPEDVINDIDDNWDLYAQWEESTSTTGIINFGSATGSTAINNTSITGDDSQNNTWTITTVFGSAGSSFTQNASYSQVGSSSKPATSITFTTTLPEEVNVTAMEAKFGGFSGTAGTITLKVGNTTIGTGSLNAADDVVVNSTTTAIGNVLTVTVTGISKGVKVYYISYTYEAAAPNPAVATTTTINVPSGFNTDIYQGTNAGTLTATVSAEGTAISGATVTWSSSDTDVATIDANGAVTLVAVGTTTITASYAGVEDEYRPSYDTYELTVTSSEPIPGTETDPYTVAEAITFIDGLNGETSSEVYVTGIISQIDSYNSNYHSITYWISDDGTTTNQLEVYSGKGLNGANFNSADDLIIGSIVTVKGNLKKYGDVYEFNYNSEIVSLTPPAQHTLTVAMTNVAEYFVFVGNDEIVFDNNNQAQISEGATVYVSLTMEDCYALNSLTVNGSTTGVTEEEPGVYYSFVMPDGDATIGVSSTQATQYTLTVVGEENVTFEMLAGSESTSVTLTNGSTTLCEQTHVTIANLTANSGLLIQSVTLTAGGSTTTLTPESGVYQFNMPSNNATLTITTAEVPTYTLATSIVSGKTYIIVGFDNSDNAYAMGTQNNNNRAGVGITVDGTTATGNADVHEVVITALEGDDAGKYTIYENGFLYASSSNGNQLKTETNLDENGNGKWTIVIDEDGEATITAQGNNTRNRMRFNPNNNNPIFACYAESSTTGSLPKLYVKDETPAEETFTLDIAQYTSKENGWYLIASPVSVDLESNTMVSGTYDLYRFNPTAELEWENYKNTEHTDFTTLEVGRGYLYANGNDGGIQLSFTGVPANNGEVTAAFTGWNLIGNPFGTAATVDKDYYRMNDTHNGIMTEASTGNVAKMEGIFVNATEGETITFTPVTEGSSEGKSAVEMNLSQNRGGVIDRAIVRFGNSNTLPKFQLFENSTKIYFAQNGEEYAILGAEPQGEMPVSFKASENGSYTLSVNTTEVEMSYLHLIDNLTGADIDLLSNPSYTFNAQTGDIETRFRLVFNAKSDNENLDEPFAFVSNGQLIVSGEGTLQVFDVLGHQILTKELSVFRSQFSVFNAPGVYVLRLTDGTNVRTQKIVVE